jgi:hypothetical protein
MAPTYSRGCTVYGVYKAETGGNSRRLLKEIAIIANGSLMYCGMNVVEAEAAVSYIQGNEYNALNAHDEWTLQFRDPDPLAHRIDVAMARAEIAAADEKKQ